MIRLVKEGEYSLIETKGQTKIISLNGRRTYAWVHAKNIGEILITSHKKHVADYVLSKGTYRLYDVKDELSFSDQLHLELHVGNGIWQGYLLLTGLPTDRKKRNRIIPTKETISQSKMS